MQKLRFLNGCSFLFGLILASACSGGGEPRSPASVDGGGAGGASSAGGASAGGPSAGAPASGGAPNPVDCTAAWPSNAPALKDDHWTSINPPSLKFVGEPQTGPFVQGMAVDPCNSAIIYLCVDSFDISQGGGLYKTVDAGATWNKIGQLDEPVRVRVDPKNSLHLYAVDGVRGDTMGFWVSQDGGQSWTKPDAWKALAPATYTIDDLYDVAVDPADFNHALVTFHSPWGTTAAGQNSGVIETKDGGNSWVAHQPKGDWSAGLNVWFLDNAQSWLVGTQSNGYWRTTDAGGTWAQVSTTSMFHGGGQLYKSKPGALYVSSASGVMRSADNGVTWTKVGTVPPATSVFGDGNRLYTHSAYLSGEEPFFTSPESDGMTWTALNAHALTDGPFEMAFDAEHGIVYSANWGNGLIALKVPAAK